VDRSNYSLPTILSEYKNEEIQGTVLEPYRYDSDKNSKKTGISIEQDLV